MTMSYPFVCLMKHKAKIRVFKTSQEKNAGGRGHCHKSRPTFSQDPKGVSGGYMSHLDKRKDINLAITSKYPGKGQKCITTSFEIIL